MNIKEMMVTLLLSRPAAALCGAILAIPATALADSTIRHSFDGGSDGAYPTAGVTALNGLVYGTTPGTSSTGGTVFSLTANGAETVLHSFPSSATDGQVPASGLLYAGGKFYGVTSQGGAYGGGTVYSMTPAGTISILHAFGGANDGAGPEAGLLLYKGELYGTTAYGGAYGKGTVYSITKTGSEKVMYSFAGRSDGATPISGLIAVNGVLWGTTEYGGYGTASACQMKGCGTVFSITPAGAYAQQHVFNGGASDGQWPASGLTNLEGTLYGTTQNAGANGWGAVYRITASGAESLLHSFSGATDGATPTSSLLSTGGALYGTTSFYGPHGNGTVFKLTSAGVMSVIYGFGAVQNDGNAPTAALINVSGTLFGTTNGGGSDNLGTVFSVPK